MSDPERSSTRQGEGPKRSACLPAKPQLINCHKLSSLWAGPEISQYVWPNISISMLWQYCRWYYCYLNKISKVAIDKCDNFLAYSCTKQEIIDHKLAAFFHKKLCKIFNDSSMSVDCLNDSLPFSDSLLSFHPLHVVKGPDSCCTNQIFFNYCERTTNKDLIKGQTPQTARVSMLSDCLIHFVYCCKTKIAPTIVTCLHI